MSLLELGQRFRFLANRIERRLWVKPLGICLLSIGAALVAKAAEGTRLDRILPRVTTDSIPRAVRASRGQ